MDPAVIQLTPALAVHVDVVVVAGLQQNAIEPSGCVVPAPQDREVESGAAPPVQSYPDPPIEQSIAESALQTAVVDPVVQQ